MFTLNSGEGEGATDKRSELNVSTKMRYEKVK